MEPLLCGIVAGAVQNCKLSALPTVGAFPLAADLTTASVVSPVQQGQGKQYLPSPLSSALCMLSS